MGTIVKATTMDAAIAKLMVNTNSLKSKESKPPIKRKGNTATKLVLVEAMRADSTVEALAMDFSMT